MACQSSICPVDFGRRFRKLNFVLDREERS